VNPDFSDALETAQSLMKPFSEYGCAGCPNYFIYRLVRQSSFFFLFLPKKKEASMHNKLQERFHLLLLV
jgi:hypothetical protein